MPRETFQRDSLTGPTILQATNGSRIATYGQQSLTLDLGLRRSFPWIFTIADVEIPILGADLLTQFSLTIDMKKLRHSSPSPPHRQTLPHILSEFTLLVDLTLQFLIIYSGSIRSFFSRHKSH